MSECIFCKKNNGYGGYRDGGCEMLKEKHVLSPNDLICKGLELVEQERAESILSIMPERREGYHYLKKINRQREEILKTQRNEAEKLHRPDVYRRT